MNQVEFHTTCEGVIKKLDEEFEVVVLIGLPEDGRSEGYNVSIHDSRPERAIIHVAKDIDKYHVDDVDASDWF